MSSDFRFDINNRIFQQGIDREVQAVDLWNTGPCTLIPSGPLLIEVSNESSAPYEFVYGEDQSLQRIGNFVEFDGQVEVRRIFTIPPGAQFKEIVNPSKKYAGIFLIVAEVGATGNITSLGIADRPPSTLIKGVSYESGV